MRRTVIILLALSYAAPPPAPAREQCADASACRQAALDAAAAGEFETFHDLAWRAVQKGKPNDPELMLLLARAQSLSGRPGDALVMLRRLAEQGVTTDVHSSDDFRRVRALPGWPEVEALFTSVPPAPAPAPSVSAAAAASAPAPPAAKPAARTPSGRSAPTEMPAASSTSAASPAPRIEAAWSDDELRVTGASIPTVGLVHDSVSRRFIVGDRLANKLVVVDEVFNRVNDLVAADSGGFFGLRAMAIDSRQGDLWVANSAKDRPPSLHKLQLVSGRVLFELPLPAGFGDATFEDLALTPDGAVLLVDARGGRLLRVAPGAPTFTRVLADEALQTATSVAAADERIAYVAHRTGLIRADLGSASVVPVQLARGTKNTDGLGLGGFTRVRWHRGALIGIQPGSGGSYRILRMSLSRSGTRVIAVEPLDEAAAMPDPTAAVIDGGVLFYVTQKDGASIVRRIRLQ